MNRPQIPLIPALPFFHRQPTEDLPLPSVEERRSSGHPPKSIWENIKDDPREPDYGEYDESDEYESDDYGFPDPEEENEGEDYEYDEDEYDDQDEDQDQDQD